MASGPLRRFRLAYDVSELFRRYFITTLFDSTFVALGVVSATALAPNPNLALTLRTLVATCVAVGVSTGVGVYEAERLEGEIRITKMERAMLSDMRDTDVSRAIRSFRLFVSLVNLAVPLLVLAIVAAPLLASSTLRTPTPGTAALVSIALAISIIFVAGTLLGRLAKRSMVREGLRMSVAALATFLLLLALETWVF